MEQQEDGTFSSKFKLYMGSEYTSQVFISTDLRYVAVKLSLGKNELLVSSTKTGSAYYAVDTR